MKVLSIDPGYDRVGIALLEKISGKVSLLTSECFRTDNTLSLDKRIYTIGEHIRNLCNLHNPSALAIETVFFTTNQKTVMGVAEARGVIKFVALDANVPVYEYTPLQVKVAITGNGKASKENVAFLTEKMVTFNREERTNKLGGASTGLDDELDAIAIGITHFAFDSSRDLEKRLGQY